MTFFLFRSCDITPTGKRVSKDAIPVAPRAVPIAEGESPNPWAYGVTKGVYDAIEIKNKVAIVKNKAI
jgi:hypothetical protein